MTLSMTNDVIIKPDHLSIAESATSIAESSDESLSPLNSIVSAEGDFR